LSSEHVERRLAAILAADVAGFCRLIGIDEEGALAQLKALRKTLFDPKIADLPRGGFGSSWAPSRSNGDGGPAA
jgi:hypothetical protein